MAVPALPTRLRYCPAPCDCRTRQTATSQLTDKGFVPVWECGNCGRTTPRKVKK